MGNLTANGYIYMMDIKLKFLIFKLYNLFKCPIMLILSRNKIESRNIAQYWLMPFIHLCE